MSVDRMLLPAALYTAEQTRILDRTAIEQFGIPGIRLMQRAGHAVFAILLERFPDLKRMTVLAGAGNNGGDGFVIAQLARQKGIDVQLLCLGDDLFESKLQGEALQAWQQLQQYAPGYSLYDETVDLTGQLVVDAMLGTGLTGAVKGRYATAIAQINRAHLPVVAVDIPSGICADSGSVLGQAVKADMTVTFIGLKRGLFTAEAVDYCGEILFDNLKVPDEVYDVIPVSVFCSSREDIAECLPRREPSCHKGKNGHLLIVGGDHGMGGAALMASQAAMRSGAGLVSLATRSEHVTASLSRCPEVMVHGVESVHQLLPLLEKADVVLIGPGLGQSAWSGQMLAAVLSSGLDRVLDADALNLVAQRGLLKQNLDCQQIVTPHPGEAARLLGETVSQIGRERFAAVTRLQQRCGGTAILKGAGTLTTAGDVSYLCSAGNPGMAVAGMGDVLAGVCSALMAQGLTAEDAARVGVFVHATAADRVVQDQGERGLLASDLCGWLPKVINNLYV